MNVESMNVPLVLLKGALAGAALAVVAGRSHKRGTQILAAGLVLAAAIYLGFAIVAKAGPGWLAVEALGILFYGALALAALRGSRWWMVAGWALHPAWDLAVHHLGPGDWISPDRYEIACLAFDVVVAAMVALRITTRRPAIATAGQSS